MFFRSFLSRSSSGFSGSSDFMRKDGFSLIEVLASVVVLSMVATGVTAVWRLADEKAFAARIDHRAAQVLREAYEQMAYGGRVIGSPTPIYTPLYHPIDRDPHGNIAHKDVINAQLTVSGDSTQESTHITLTYTLPAVGLIPPRTVTKSVQVPLKVSSGQ